MSMAEILGMLNEKAKEDNNKHSPWTRMVLEKDLLKEINKNCYCNRICQDYETKKEERTWETEKGIRIQLPILQYTERTILMVN